MDGSERPAAKANSICCASFSSLKAAAPSELSAEILLRKILTQGLMPLAVPV